MRLTGIVGSSFDLAYTTARSVNVRKSLETTICGSYWKAERHYIVYGVAEGYIAEQEGADYVAEREKKGKTLKEVALI